MKLAFCIYIILLTCPTWAKESLVYYDSYEENKKAFIEKSFGRPSQSWFLKSDATLTTDLAFYNYNSEQVLVVSSGIHGIEGYVGSSLQRWMIDVLAGKKSLKTDVLLIHSLNPWGMKNKRRVNEINIDLNRNFQTSLDLYQKKNEDYDKINEFLNPKSDVSLNFFGRLGFLTKAVQLILSYSMESLRKSVLLGQYNHPQGLYYGGGAPDALQAHIDELFAKDLKHYKKVVWIDLHTAYGERGKLHLLADDSNSEAGKKLALQFSHYPIDFGNQKNFYKTSGDLASYLNLKNSKKQEVIAAVFEYGTMDSQKTLGSIESLRRMVLENQGFHRGYADKTSQNETETLFREMCYPHDEEWKTKILLQTQKILSPLLEISE